MDIRPLHDRVVVKRIEEERDHAGRSLHPGFCEGKAAAGRGCRGGKWQATDDGKVIALDVRWATASCSASIPAATSSWMAMST